MEACQNPEVLKVIMFISELLKILFVVVPIGLIIIILFSFFKKVASSELDDNKEAVKVAKRILYCVILFCVPAIVSFVNNILGNAGLAVGYSECISNANSNYINSRIEFLAEEAVAKAKEDMNISSILQAEEAVKKMTNQDKKSSLLSELEELRSNIGSQSSSSN